MLISLLTMSVEMIFELHQTNYVIKRLFNNVYQVHLIFINSLTYLFNSFCHIKIIILMNTTAEFLFKLCHVF